MDQNLLLHFWTLAVQIFVPQQIERDGSQKFLGYTIAVPEVTNLVDFPSEYRRLLNDLNNGLDPDHSVRGLT